MTPDEYKWNINFIKDRHHTLNLTFEQAEKVYRYERDKDTYSYKHYFSFWEEWDYELTIFREILNDEQFSTYERLQNEIIQRYVKGLIEQDNENGNEIAYHESLINFYETQFLPEFFKDPFLRTGWLYNDKAKAEYLRSEYKYFLNDIKKEILANHFRQYRTYKPNELKVSLLRHKVSCVFPDYKHFKIKMDEPTKAVAHFIISQLHYLPDHVEELLIRKFKELKDFNEANLKRYHNDTSGLHVIGGQQTEEEKKENRAMTLLLLDEGKYGYPDTI